MARTPWVLTDWSTGIPDTYEFPINPREYSPPGKKASFAFQRPTAPNGQAILFQGLNEIAEGSFSGVVKTQNEFETLDAWVEKWYPVYLTDDRSNTWQILFTEISWTRKHRHIDPDTYEYTAKFLELPQ